MKKSILLLGFILAISNLHSQIYKSVTSDSKMTIKGTSSLHDWESVVEDFSVNILFEEDTISKASFVAIVKSIKSGKSVMDKNTYKALKADEFSKISFSAKNLQINETSITGVGNLTVAGKTNTIPVAIQMESWDQDYYHLIGDFKLEMTNYDISPPTAVLGTIKTGDEITISFSISMEKELIGGG